MRTIVAQATAHGISGLAIIRVSGAKAFELVDIFFSGKKKICDAKSHTILYGNFIEDGNIIDDVTISIFRAPHSYTGDDVVEIGCHGGNIIPQKIISMLISAGCTYADAGEFTRRAFINGKLNLMQAEAVADLIHSISLPSAITSARQLHGGFTKQLSDIRKNLINIAALLELDLDFAEDEVAIFDSSKIKEDLTNALHLCEYLRSSYNSANILREGFFVTICGLPNSGKSTLFNAILNKNRAIVSNIPGTTRDYLEESIIINDIAIKFIDTAGLRETQNFIESEGIKLVYDKLEEANLVLFLKDVTEQDTTAINIYNELKQKYPAQKFLFVNNKCDLLENNLLTPQKNTINISAKNQDDVEKLKQEIGKIAKDCVNIDNEILLNQRQYHLLGKSIEHLLTAIEDLGSGVSSEFIAPSVRSAGNAIGKINGETWNDEVLNNIFSNFCIGK